MENKQTNNYYGDIEKKPFVRFLRLYFKYLGNIFSGFSVYIFARLFATPQKRKIRSRHIEFLDTATLKETLYAENEQIRMYIWQGNEKKILITHGWAGMAADFKELITELHQKGFTVMAFDLPAHGFSSGKQTHMPMVMEVIKSIIEKYGSFYAMIGHSLGAASIVYALAELSKDKNPDKLVLLGVPTAPFVFFKQFKSLLSINDKLFDKCVNYIEKLVGRKIQGMSIEKAFPKIPVKKVLIIHDNQDKIIPLGEIKVISDKWKNALFFSGNHGGHFRHYKHPEVVKKISSFL
jgi:pimeloyl-ACP methyl ester carboxylesterase